MGTLGNGLPDLPPEWGEVVIPDDPAELAEEAERVRDELRHEARAARRARWRARWRRRLHLPEHIDDPDQPSLVLPLVVLGIAVVITLLSLLLIAWPGLTRPTPETPQPGPPVHPTVSAPAGTNSPPTGTTSPPAGTVSAPADAPSAGQPGAVSVPGHVPATGPGSGTPSAPAPATQPSGPAGVR